MDGMYGDAGMYPPNYLKRQLYNKIIMQLLARNWRGCWSE